MVCAYYCFDPEYALPRGPGRPRRNRRANKRQRAARRRNR